ncbi:hypothetical protein [Pedobacter sp. NJ-S-72]
MLRSHPLRLTISVCGSLPKKGTSGISPATIPGTAAWSGGWHHCPVRPEPADLTPADQAGDGATRKALNALRWW